MRRRKLIHTSFGDIDYDYEDGLGGTPVYTIAGTVLDGVTPVSGVLVTLGAYSDTTDASGEYLIIDIPGGTSGNLTPTKTDYTFVPTSTAIAAMSANLTGKDFAATPFYTIAGTVADAAAAGINLVSVALGAYSDNSDTGGDYLITSVPGGTSGSLTPTLANYQFDPATIAVSAMAANLTSKDFTGYGFLINDLFSATYAAGAKNATVAPGLGTTAQRTVVVVDTNSKLTEGSGVLNFATGGSAVGNPGLWYGSIARAAGRFLIAEVTPAGTTNTSVGVGWDSAATGAILDSLNFAASGAIQLVVNGGTAVTVGTYTAATHSVAAVHSATGIYWYIKGGAYTPWTYLMKTASGTAATFAGAGALGTTAVATLDYFRVMDDIIIASLTSKLYDNFTRDNGVLGTSLATCQDGQAATARLWTGATWAIDTNQAKNTPTEGADMVDAGAGVFTSGTYAWTPYGTNTIANVGNELEITYVDNSLGAQDSFADVKDLNANLTVGTWYRVDWQSYVNVGSSVGINIWALYDRVTTETQNVLTSHFQVFRASSATTNNIGCSFMGAGEIIYIDNWTLKALTDATLYATTTDIGEDDVVIEVDLATVVAGAQAGVRFAYVDANNYLLCYYDKQLGKVMLDQCLAGTWSNLFITTKTYAAAARLIIWKSGTAVRVYAGIVGSEALVTATTCNAAVAVGTQVALFSTDVGNRISLIDVRGVGNNNEYSFFDNYLP